MKSIVQATVVVILSMFFTAYFSILIDIQSILQYATDCIGPKEQLALLKSTVR